jgi:poly(3-hydroxybutyrate) depolymerase
VSPNGLNQGWGNAGGEDIALVDAIVKNIDEKLCVDQTLRFATGFSYGGAMSHSVACSRANVFRAVSVIAGATLSGCDGGNTPIAYQSIHGISDNVLPISMGRELRDRFIRVNGCQNQNAQEPRQGSGTHIKTEYKGCRAGYPVTYIAHDGGHVAEPADRGQGNFAPQATWSFFSQFN